MNQLVSILESQKDRRFGQQCALPRAKTDGRLPLLPGFEHTQYVVMSYFETPTVERIQKRVGNEYKRLSAEAKVKPGDLACAFAIMGIYEKEEEADKWAKYLSEHYQGVNFCYIPFATFRFFPSFIDPRTKETTNYANPQLQDFFEKHRKRQEQLERTHNVKLSEVQRKSDDVRERHDKEIQNKRINKMLDDKFAEIKYEETARAMKEAAQEKGDGELVKKIEGLTIDENHRLPPLDKLEAEKRELSLKAYQERMKILRKSRQSLKH